MVRVSKNAKQYRLERDEARKEIQRLTAALKCIGHAVIKGLDR